MDNSSTPAEDQDRHRHLVAFNTGLSFAAICHDQVRVRLLTRRGFDLQLYEARLQELDRMLSLLLPAKDRSAIAYFVNSLQLIFHDERDEEAFADLESRAIDAFETTGELTLGKKWVVDEIASTMGYVERSIRGLLQTPKVVEGPVSRLFELGFAVGGLCYYYSDIERFIHLAWPDPPEPPPDSPPPDSSITSDDQDAEQPDPRHPCESDRRPILIISDHTPGSIPFRQSQVEIVQTRLRQAAPPLAGNEVHSIERLLDNSQGSCFEPVDVYRQIVQRLQFAISPVVCPNEVDWKGVRVNLETGRIWWGKALQFQTDDKPALRLLHILIEHHGKVDQSVAVERIYSAGSSVKNRYEQLRKVRDRLNQQLRKHRGSSVPKEIVMASSPSGGKRKKHAPDGHLAISPEAWPEPPETSALTAEIADEH